MTESAAAGPAVPAAPRITMAAASVYLIASSVLWAVGFAVTSFLLLLGVVLAVTPFGLWIVAAAVSSARGFGRLYRALVYKLFRERLEPPAERTEHGVLAWRRFLLGDGGGWMEVAFLSIRVPLAVLNLVVGVGLWIYGLLWLLWPLLNWDDIYTPQSDGTVRRGLHSFGIWLDTLPRAFLVSVVGAAVIGRVTDDGRGGAAPRPGGGLAGLGDRVGTVDGTVVIDSPPGGPTVVTVDLPTKP